LQDRRNGASMLARQLKLRLIAEGSDIPRACSNVVVSIHAIATFQAFNDYLRPRIAQASERTSISAPAGSSTRLSGALAAFAAAAGIPPPPSPGTPPSRLASSLGSSTAAAGPGPSTQANLGAEGNAESSRRRLSGRGANVPDAHQECVLVLPDLFLFSYGH
jgi:E3 ubiquitin-protein ligase TRIP12